MVTIIILSCAQCMAVVPYPISTKEKAEARTKEERLQEVIEKIETQEKANIKFYHDIKDEVKQILKKENTVNTWTMKDKIYWAEAGLCALLVMYLLVSILMRH